MPMSRGLVHLPPSQSQTSLQKQKSGPLLDRSCLWLQSREVKAIEIHHFVPGRRKVTHEDRLRVAARIHFGQPSQLRVRSEDEINNASRPLWIPGGPIESLQHALCTGPLPFRGHVEKIHEVIIGQRAGLIGENTV